MTKFEIIEKWRKTNPAYCFADLLEIVDEAYKLGAADKDAEWLAEVEAQKYD